MATPIPILASVVNPPLSLPSEVGPMLDVAVVTPSVLDVVELVLVLAAKVELLVKLVVLVVEVELVSVILKVSLTAIGLISPS